MSPHVTHVTPCFPAVLAKDGHEIILEQIEDWNLVELVVNEETVFQCDIQDLEFGKALGSLCSAPSLRRELPQFLPELVRESCLEPN